MRVLCINGGPYPQEEGDSYFPPLKEGEFYTVVGQAIGHYRDGTEVECFRISGVPEWLYEKDRFILPKSN